MKTHHTCIVCNNFQHSPTIEHIIPQSLGNVHYILHKGLVCGQCNHRFSQYENRVVSSVPFLTARNIKFRKAPDLEEKDITFVLLKIAYESMYRSRKTIWNTIDWTETLDTIVKGRPYPSSLISNKKLKKGKNIPGFIERIRLRVIGHELKYAMRHDSILVYWRFQNEHFIVPLKKKKLA